MENSLKELKNSEKKTREILCVVAYFELSESADLISR
jgi:hypothetical protein